MPYDRALGRVFLFDATDLEHNRHRELSPEQALIIGNAARRERRRGPRVIALVTLLMAGAAVLVVWAGTGTPGGGTTPLAVGLGILAWVGVLLAAGLTWGRRHRAALESPRVLTVEGVPEVSPAAFGNVWNVRIGDVTFGLETLQVQALGDRHAYRVHYMAPGVGKPVPLSLERLAPVPA